MFPIVEPRQRPERFLLNRFSPLAENAALLGLGGFDAAGSVWYPDARRLLGAVPNDGTLTNMDPATDWVWVPELGRWALDFGIRGSLDYVAADTPAMPDDWTLAAWVKPGSTTDNCYLWDFGDADEAAAVYGFQDGYYNMFGGAYPIGSNAANSQMAMSGAGIWDHVAWTKNGTNLKGFVNGSQIVNGDITAGDMSPSASARIGRPWSTAASSMNGQLSDILFFSQALSAGAISALADPSNVMLEVGGVPLILPPHRVSFPAAVAEPVLTYRNYILGGGVI